MNRIDDLQTTSLASVQTPQGALDALEALDAALNDAQEHATALAEWIRKGGFWPLRVES